MIPIDDVGVRIIVKTGDARKELRDFARFVASKKKEVAKGSDGSARASSTPGGIATEVGREIVGELRKGEKLQKALLGQFIKQVAKRDPRIALALEALALGFETLSGVEMTTIQRIQIAHQQIDQLKSAVASLQNSTRAAQIPAVQLRKQFGPQLGELPKVLQLQKSLDQADAGAKLTKSTEKLIELIDKAGTISIKFDAGELRNAQSEFEELRALDNTSRLGPRLKTH